MSVIPHLAWRESTGKRKRDPSDFGRHEWWRHPRKRIRSRRMGDTSMEGGKSRVHSSWEGHLIPGVDGKTTFGFPQKIITILRYVESVVLTSTTGSVAFNAFRMNALFDPNATGAGHQPMYFDNYAALYDRYR